jgi:hypothetical protein
MLHNNIISKPLPEVIELIHKNKVEDPEKLIDELLIIYKEPKDKNRILKEKAILLHRKKNNINDAINILNTIVSSSQDDDEMLISALINLVYCYHYIRDEEGILKTIKNIPQQYKSNPTILKLWMNYSLIYSKNFDLLEECKLLKKDVTDEELKKTHWKSTRGFDANNQREYRKLIATVFEHRVLFSQLYNNEITTSSLPNLKEIIAIIKNKNIDLSIRISYLHELANIFKQLTYNETDLANLALTIENALQDLVNSNISNKLQLQARIFYCYAIWKGVGDDESAAINLFEKAFKFDPYQWNAYLTYFYYLRVILENPTEMIDKAKNLLNETIKNLPKNKNVPSDKWYAKLYLQIGIAYEELCNLNKSQYYKELALSYDPTNAAALSAENKNSLPSKKTTQQYYAAMNYDKKRFNYNHPIEKPNPKVQLISTELEYDSKIVNTQIVQEDFPGLADNISSSSTSQDSNKSRTDTKSYLDVAKSPKAAKRPKKTSWDNASQTTTTTSTSSTSTIDTSSNIDQFDDEDEWIRDIWNNYPTYENDNAEETSQPEQSDVEIVKVEDWEELVTQEMDMGSAPKMKAHMELKQLIQPAYDLDLIQPCLQLQPALGTNVAVVKSYIRKQNIAFSQYHLYPLFDLYLEGNSIIEINRDKFQQIFAKLICEQQPNKTDAELNDLVTEFTTWFIKACDKKLFSSSDKHFFFRQIKYAIANYLKAESMENIASSLANRTVVERWNTLFSQCTLFANNTEKPIDDSDVAPGLSYNSDF